MRKLILISTFLVPLFCHGQAQPKGDIFPSFGNYERKGWLVNPALTYMVGPVKAAQDRIWLGSDSVYDVAYDAQGKVGVGLEIARFYAIDHSPIISYVDFALGLKILHGVERYTAILDDPDRLQPYSRKGGGTFSHSYFTASFNATNSIPLAKSLFLNNTLGINGDYRFADAYTYNEQGIPMHLNTPERFVFQAHYSIGIGFKLSPNMMLIPSVETPIVNFYTYDDLKSTFAIFNSRYRPLIFRLTLLVLDNKPDRKCPKKVRSRKNKESLFGTLDSKRPW